MPEPTPAQRLVGDFAPRIRNAPPIPQPTRSVAVAAASKEEIQ
jgi:hypothetical protein